MKSMIMDKTVFNRKLAKAKHYLLRKGIVALDGSGHEEVESLFIMLRYFQYGKLKIVEKQERKA